MKIRSYTRTISCN